MTETLPAIRKRLSLPVMPDQAFNILTLHLAEWWPMASHSLSGNEGKLPKEVLIEPRVGGRIVELRHDGERADWGTITNWEPGRRFGIDWYVGRAPAHATHWEVSFAPAPGGTEAVLVHTGFDRLGPAGEAAAANYDEGWDLVFGECYRGACED